MLDRLKADQLQGNQQYKGKLIRHHIESQLPLPEEIKTAIIDGWKKSGEEWAYAVRSSATAEDLKAISFLRLEHDTYLNVMVRTRFSRRSRNARLPCSPTGPLFTACRTDLFIVRFFIGSGTAHGFPQSVRNHVYSHDPVTGNRKDHIYLTRSYGIRRSAGKEGMVSGLICVPG